MRLLKDQDLSNKNVVVRLDLNVPIQNKQIIDSTRIISSVPTIKYLVDKNCKVLLTSHLGRPEEGKFDQDFLRKESLINTSRCLLSLKNYPKS